MPLPGIYFTPKRPYRYDDDSLNFFAAVMDGGGSLAESEQLAIDKLVRKLKYNGIWYKCLVIYPFVGASAAAHSINLRTPAAHALTFYGSPSHTPNGTYFGAGQYASTGLTPAVNLVKTDQHWAVWSRTNVPDGNVHALLGDTNVNNGTYDWITAAPPDAILFQLTGGQNAWHTTPGSVHFAAMSRANESTVTAVVGDAIVDYVQPVSASQNTSEIRIAYGNGFSGLYECAFASLGGALTHSDMLDYYSAIQEFQSNLLR